MRFPFALTANWFVLIVSSPLFAPKILSDHPVIGRPSARLKSSRTGVVGNAI